MPGHQDDQQKEKEGVGEDPHQLPELMLINVRRSSEKGQSFPRSEVEHEPVADSDESRRQKWHRVPSGDLELDSCGYSPQAQGGNERRHAVVGDQDTADQSGDQAGRESSECSGCDADSLGEICPIQDLHDL